MIKSFASPAAFKTSLEARIRTIAGQRDVPINTLRLKLVIERLLARLFSQKNPPWVLKGGYAMELRYRPRARTTRDIDLTYDASGSMELQARIRYVREQLQAAADIDLSDYLAFRIEEAQTELAGAPLGGARFPCEAFLAGKTYGRFHIDVGFGDDVGTATEMLSGDDLLAFAGIPPAQALAISKPQQFAEKLHAYTRPWDDRINMRTKDLVDLVLLIETASVEPADVNAAVHTTFAKRDTHPIPVELPDPPARWSDEFTALAAEAHLQATTLSAAIGVLRVFWQRV
ncbi:MAG: nucleotidyl transferase AbiEii/AbiGii toxin family protein [Phycisphaerales bacterium]|nr:nucleotidyl transferase AbiEii/AbiGii toxin family protein [Phycisphaerales bacterium]